MPTNAKSSTLKKRTVEEATEFAEDGASRQVPSPRKAGEGIIPPGDVRFTMNMRKELHLRLKIAAAKDDRTMAELIEELIERYVPKT